MWGTGHLAPSTGVCWAKAPVGRQTLGSCGCRLAQLPRGPPGFPECVGLGPAGLDRGCFCSTSALPRSHGGPGRTSPSVSVSHSVSTVPGPRFPSCADSVSKCPDPLPSRARPRRFCPLYAGPVLALCTPCLSLVQAAVGSTRSHPGAFLSCTHAPYWAPDVTEGSWSLQGAGGWGRPGGWGWGSASA